MYRTFNPKPASQGLPPEDPEVCHHWGKSLFEIGKNFLAWSGDTIIGHAVIVPDMNDKSGEFVIFIQQHHRNVGIGTELTRFALEQSRESGFDSIWLAVNLTNAIAIKLYRKFGFEYRDRLKRLETGNRKIPENMKKYGPVSNIGSQRPRREVSAPTPTVRRSTS